MPKTRERLDDFEDKAGLVLSLVKNVVIIALNVAAVAGLLALLLGLFGVIDIFPSRTEARAWLDQPLSQLKVWHLALMLLATALLAKD